MIQAWPKFLHLHECCDWFRNKYKTQTRRSRIFPGTFFLGLSEKNLPCRGCDRLVVYEVGLWQAILPTIKHEPAREMKSKTEY